ncbi:MAG: hypothetical protein H0X16_09585 [Chloroflexi bacterium]|nr:hypothetical protein [Chloroflexota bacterium]
MTEQRVAGRLSRAEGRPWRALAPAALAAAVLMVVVLGMAQDPNLGVASPAPAATDALTSSQLPISGSPSAGATVVPTESLVRETVEDFTFDRPASWYLVRPEPALRAGVFQWLTSVPLAEGCARSTEGGAFPSPACLPNSELPEGGVVLAFGGGGRYPSSLPATPLPIETGASASCSALGGKEFRSTIRATQIVACARGEGAEQAVRSLIASIELVPPPSPSASPKVDLTGFAPPQELIEAMAEVGHELSPPTAADLDMVRIAPQDAEQIALAGRSPSCDLGDVRPRWTDVGFVYLGRFRGLYAPASGGGTPPPPTLSYVVQLFAPPGAGVPGCRTGLTSVDARTGERGGDYSPCVGPLCGRRATDSSPSLLPENAEPAVYISEGEINRISRRLVDRLMSFYESRTPGLAEIFTEAGLRQALDRDEWLGRVRDGEVRLEREYEVIFDSEGFTRYLSDGTPVRTRLAILVELAPGAMVVDARTGQILEEADERERVVFNVELVREAVGEPWLVDAWLPPEEWPVTDVPDGPTTTGPTCEWSLDSPPAEEPWTFDYPGRPWCHVDGYQLSVERMNLHRGPAHCGWESSASLDVGDPLGAEIDPFRGLREYVRDPRGIFVDRVVRPYDGGAQLPSDAVDTGYRNGRLQLWVSPSDAGNAIYILNGDVVELWPRTPEPIACR